MKLASLLLILAALPLAASEFPADVANRIADAIWHAEGGNRASTPYGVRGCKDPARARRIVLGLIQSEWQAYEKRLEVGMENRSFIEALGFVYCPPTAHPLNKNWNRNVTYHFKKGSKL